MDKTQPSAFDAVADLFPSDSSYIAEETWTLLAASAVLAFGKLSSAFIDHLVTSILKPPPSQVHNGVDLEVFEKQLRLFRRLREGFLKASALVGFPLSINALNFLKASLDANAPDLSARLKKDTSIRGPIPLSERHSRGRAFFNDTYGKQANTILTSLNESSGGDLGEFAINCVYGDLVAETSLVGRKETGLLQFTCCLALGKDCAPQAKGHMYGARTLGNSGAEIRSVIAMVEHLAGVFDVTWKRDEMPFLDKSLQW